MAVTVSEVDKNSPAKKAGIQKDDIIVAIGGNEINDVLDYQFYAADVNLAIEILRRGVPYSIKLKKHQYEDLGLEFTTYLMDKQRSCCNNCIFCFIDQNPPNMRESIYFKDDDDRLSFLFGNYITLTNLSDHDVERIIKMKISPINISVHTTNPQLRCKMMHNRFAGEALKKLYTIAKSDVKINAQLVLVPGINDGEELQNTLKTLDSLYPAVQSIACVPVGVTSYRENLFPLDTYNEVTAGETIDIIERFSAECVKNHRERICYASDEFFILAKREIPPPGYYGDFDQLDNGVGLIAALQDEFYHTLPLMEAKNTKRKFTAVTGEAAYPYILKLFKALEEADKNLELQLVCVKNKFFGGKITVAGLVTGGDIIKELEGKELGDLLIIPDSMLRHEKDKFLDDLSVDELSRRLALPVRVIASDGGALAEIIEI